MTVFFTVKLKVTFFFTMDQHKVPHDSKLTWFYFDEMRKSSEYEHLRKALIIKQSFLVYISGV